MTSIANSALLRWKHTTKVHPEAGLTLHYMIIAETERQPLKAETYQIVQCYPNTWNVSSVIAGKLTRQQAEHRIARIVERADCEIV
jgi:hypothetical protein